MLIPVIADLARKCDVDHTAGVRYAGNKQDRAFVTPARPQRAGQNGQKGTEMDIKGQAASIVVNAAVLAADAPTFASRLESALSGVQLAKAINAGYVDSVNESGQTSLNQTFGVLTCASLAIEAIKADQTIDTSKGVPVEKTLWRMIEAMSGFLTIPDTKPETDNSPTEAPKPQPPKTRANPAK